MSLTFLSVLFFVTTSCMLPGECWQPIEASSCERFSPLINGVCYWEDVFCGKWDFIISEKPTSHSEISSANLIKLVGEY